MPQHVLQYQHRLYSKKVNSEKVKKIMESWDTDIEHPSYNPFLTLREKKVLINPRVYGKKTKSQKKDFRMEERRRWNTILNEERRKDNEKRALEDRHREERYEMELRHAAEKAELEKHHESWDGEYYVSPLYYIRQETIRRRQDDNRSLLDDCSWDDVDVTRKDVPKPNGTLDECSWDTDNYVSPLDYIRKGVHGLKL